MLSYEESVDRSQQLIAGLKDNVDKLSDADLRSTLALDAKTQSARDQERALIDRARYIRDSYLADIEAGVPEDQAHQRLLDRTEALKKEYGQAKFNKERVDALVQTYAGIPPSIQTVFVQEKFPDTVEALSGLIKQIAYAQLTAGAITLEQYKQKINMSSLIAAETLNGTRGTERGVQRAEGGRVVGPGSGTSDSIKAWLSNGEHVWTAREVQAAGGHAAVEQLRHAVLGNQLMLPGFAAGGPVRLPVTVNAEHLIDQFAASLRGPKVGYDFQAPGGVGGWQWQMRMLHAAFPGLALLSGFRPGATTVSGGLSYHASGRAVDLPPRMDVFRWIRDNYGLNTRELIFTPAGASQIHNGQPHTYSGAVAATHNSHVHWAYDQGGYLPPGLTMAYNGTGRPEPVFTADQFDAMRRPVSSQSRTLNVYPQRADFTVTDLQALMDRQEALERVGRLD